MLLEELPQSNMPIVFRLLPKELADVYKRQAHELLHTTYVKRGY